MLLDKGAEVDRADEDGVTPLHATCGNGHIDAARLLLENGAEVDRATEDGETPLHVACDGPSRRGAAAAGQLRRGRPSGKVRLDAAVHRLL